MMGVLLQNIIKLSCRNKKNLISNNNFIFQNNIHTNKYNIYKQIKQYELDKHIFKRLLPKFNNNFQNRFFSLKPNLLQNFKQDVNTKVTKDVIIYKYDNPRFFNMLNMFAICQFSFWAYLSHFAYTSLKDAPANKIEDQDISWWRKVNLGENKYRNGITILCFVIGYGILASAWAFTLKSVRYLILRKGGDAVTFVTYGPFGKNRMMTVNLKHVSSQESRQNARVTLPIKVQNTYLYYMLDMKGEFTNAKLFDYTAGLKRIFK